MSIAQKVLDPGVHPPGGMDEWQVYQIRTLAVGCRGFRKPAVRLPFASMAERLEQLAESWLSLPIQLRTDQVSATLIREREQLIETVRLYFERQARFAGNDEKPLPCHDGLPPHDEDGLLPAGKYTVGCEELFTRLGFTPRRRRQIWGLLAAMHLVKRAGGRSAIIGGSFATAKENPGDLDCQWEVEGLDLAKLHPMINPEWKAKLTDEESIFRSLRREYFGLDIFAFASRQMLKRTLVECPINFPSEFVTYPMCRSVGVLRVDLTKELPSAREFVPFSTWERPSILASSLALCRRSLPEHWSHISDAMLVSQGVHIIQETRM